MGQRVIIVGKLKKVGEGKPSKNIAV